LFEKTPLFQRCWRVLKTAQEGPCYAVVEKLEFRLAAHALSLTFYMGIEKKTDKRIFKY